MKNICLCISLFVLSLAVSEELFQEPKHEDSAEYKPPKMKTEELWQVKNLEDEDEIGDDEVHDIQPTKHPFKVRNFNIYTLSKKRRRVKIKACTMNDTTQRFHGERETCFQYSQTPSTI